VGNDLKGLKALGNESMKLKDEFWSIGSLYKWYERHACL